MLGSCSYTSWIMSEKKLQSVEIYDITPGFALLRKVFDKQYLSSCVCCPAQTHTNLEFIHPLCKAAWYTVWI